MSRLSKWSDSLIPVAAILVALGFSNAANAADQPAVAAPAMVGGAAPAADCPTCHGATTASCATCKAHRSLFHHCKTCKPYQTTFCPGACFGYFQTQWHRWENVCPIPYQGVGLADGSQRPRPRGAAPAPAPVRPQTRGSDFPLPNLAVPSIPGK